MSVRNSLAKILVFGFLLLARLGGAQMTPEEIERLMNVMHRTKIVQIKKTEE